MRQAYVVHILDQVLSERTIVAWNDRAIAEEEAEEEAAINGQKVTLDNVFDLAKQEAGADSDSADESDSDDDADPKAARDSLLETTNLVKPASMDSFKNQSRQDQGLVRPKVLILAPFKQMAF